MEKTDSLPERFANFLLENNDGVEFTLADLGEFAREEGVSETKFPALLAAMRALDFHLVQHGRRRPEGRGFCSGRAQRA